MKNIPYYTEQHMKKSENWKTPTSECVNFVSQVFRSAVVGNLPVDNPENMVEEWKKLRREHAHILKFDFEKFFLNIDHAVLLEILDQAVFLTQGLERQNMFNLFYRQEIVRFLNATPIKNKTLPIASRLGRVLGYIILIPIIKLLNIHKIKFLYSVDDFLVFFKTQKKCDSFYWYSLLPAIQKQKLVLNQSKTQFVKSNEHLIFLGYAYSSGYFTISKQKYDELKIWLKKTIDRNCSKKKTLEHSIKIINKKLNGFFHYYKWGSVKVLFSSIDSFVRRELSACYFSSIRITNFVVTENFFMEKKLVFGKKIFEEKEQIENRTSRKLSKSKTQSKKKFLILEKIRFIQQQLQDIQRIV